LRWSRFKDYEPEDKFNIFKDVEFIFIKSLNGRAGSSYTNFMKDSVFITGYWDSHQLSTLIRSEIFSFKL